MSIVQMQKVTISALREDRKAILEKLQAMGVMEVHPIETDEDFTVMDTTAARQSFDRNVSLIENALDILEQYAPEKKSMFSSLNGKEAISGADVAKIAKKRDLAVDIAARIVRNEKNIAERKAKIARYRSDMEALEPYKNLGLPLWFQGTDTTRMFVGTMPQGTSMEELYTLIQQHADTDETIDVEAEKLSEDVNAVYLAVLCRKEDAQKVEEALRSGGFAYPSVRTSRTPQGKIDQRIEKIGKEQEEIDKLTKSIEGDADHRELLRQASDYFRMRSAKYAVLGNLQQTDSVFFLNGYVPKEAVPAVEKTIGENYRCVIDVSDLAPDEAGPTLLRNNRVSETVEGVLKSYGLPTRGHVDPTTIMSVFYIIFFGMMLSDAGYGLVMAAGCAIVLLKFKNMDAGMKKTLRMFFWCGLSTMFWGFMYGGFFGDAIDVVAKTFFGYTGDPILKPLWFAPLEEPMRLLLWCMLFGVIHLFTGLGIKGYEYLKKGDVLGWVCDILSWYLFLGGLIFMLIPSDIFASIAGRTFSFPPAVSLIAKIAAIAGAATIVLMSGRGRKNIGLRIALGAYDLYGISSWLSDVLSYSRLLALGLATGVIASVINMMASMAGGGVVGAILFILVFVLGHTLNIGINALGAYVHTNRLQFVEFFGKFYEAGGSEFSPFKTDNKYVEVKEEL
ncbi:MAG: V-type ATP synthase subunit I [Lachnospiraceae bacterium]|nr:V-type ATP synthase subunit I [Lachnospiraceae bacterium]